MSCRDESGTQLAIDVPRSPRRSPLDEPCPKCGAARGEDCRTVTSGEPAATHLARRKLARYLPTEVK